MRTINISKKYGIDIISQETDLDHIHILFKTKPQTNLIKFINNWKSSTSKVLRNRFGDILNKKLWKNILWSKSYCLLTTGQVSLEQIKQYVEGQGQ
jgi:putative transposase